MCLECGFCHLIIIFVFILLDTFIIKNYALTFLQLEEWNSKNQKNQKKSLKKNSEFEESKESKIESNRPLISEEGTIQIPSLFQKNEVSSQNFQQIKKILFDLKELDNIFEKIDTKDIIPLERETSQDLIISKIYSKVTEEQKIKNIEKLQTSKKSLELKFSQNVNHYENLFQNQTESVEFVMVALNEMIKMSPTKVDLFYEENENLPLIAKKHYLKYLTLGNEAQNSYYRMKLDETPKYQFETLKNNKEERESFIQKIKAKITESFPESVFEIRTIFRGSVELVLTTNIDLDELKKVMSTCQDEFGKIKHLSQEFNDDNIKFTADMLNSRGNYDFTTSGETQKRGGFDYYQPKGWKRFGLNVTGIFEDDEWLAMDGNSKEWACAFHGTKSQYILPIMKNNIKTGVANIYAGKRNSNFKSQGRYPTTTNGVYFGKNIGISESYASTFNVNGHQFRIAFQCRLKPEEIQIPADWQDAYIVQNDFIKTFDKIRPYGILLKKIS